MYLELSDNELLELINEQKDNDAMETLIKRYGPMITGQSRSLYIIGQTLDNTFQSTAEYIIFDHPFKLYTANLLSNAVVRNIEQISDTQVKILYGNAEDNPMFISYTGFITEKEAIDEMRHIMEHKEKYTEAVGLSEILEN